MLIQIVFKNVKSKINILLRKEAMNWREAYRNALLDTSINPSDVRKIIKPYIPNQLYRYGSFESQYWKDIIYKAHIYLAPAKIFNDPFDCRANFDYKRATSKGKFRNEQVKRFGEREVDNIPDEIVQKIYHRRNERKCFCFLFFRNMEFSFNVGALC